jgi:16S rRNA (cytidine1402-2'-O)-methyltransferase
MKLFLVGLPLGNIEDISMRAVKTLAKARLVICEDTRVFNKLWSKLKNIGYLTEDYVGKLEVLNEYNEKKKFGDLTEEIKTFGEAILISDAGMPTWSDPGFRLINEVLKEGGEISSVPGPSAMVTATAMSGLSSDRVLFLGFLPKKKSKRERYWEATECFRKLGLTIAIYEPARSVYGRLKEILDEFGNVEIVVARELTKQYEEVLRGRVEDLLKELKEVKIKGEVVLLWRLEKSRD